MNRAILPAFVIALALAGCASSTATPAEPSVTASPSAAPSPTPTLAAWEKQRDALEANREERKAAAATEEARLRAAAPTFTVTEAPVTGGGEIRVEVDRTINGGEAYSVMEVLMLDFTDPGGYFVSINCNVGGTATADHRLANGKIAVGKAGQAQVGFVKDGAMAELLDGATCP